MLLALKTWHFVGINLLGNKFISSHLQNKCIHNILSFVVCFTPVIIINPANVLFSCERQLISFHVHLVLNTIVLQLKKKSRLSGQQEASNRFCAFLYHMQLLSRQKIEKSHCSWVRIYTQNKFWKYVIKSDNTAK